MRCGIPLLGDRVAPRHTCADDMLVVTLDRGRITSTRREPLDLSGVVDFVAVLRHWQIDTLVCGGINRGARELLQTNAISVIDNVACSAAEILCALESGALRPGYGLSTPPALRGRGPGATPASPGRTPAATASGGGPAARLDCIRCEDRACLRGENCRPDLLGSSAELAPEQRQMLEAATDVSGEEERKLCRLSELVYFCLEMRYRRIGIAFCVDLLEPARILTQVLSRFFDVVPVCCKVGGIPSSTAETEGRGPGPVGGVACNPGGQARLLNESEADMNLIVGLCVGADSVFSELSRAPVTTLFVKDRSLANNPIGAVYSEYYLRESVTPEAASLPPAARGGPRSSIAEDSPHIVSGEERS
jgi:uncharacterized metal-binding protein/predicted Fe-Mo cluster-binding NifX family protein